MKRGFLLSTLLVSFAASASADPALDALDCKHQGGGPVYDCTFKLVDEETGAPFSNARFKILTTMPSMPMAHNSPPIEAVKGEAPGTYHARLPLDMYGTWRLSLRVTEPEAVQIDHTADFVP